MAPVTPKDEGAARASPPRRRHSSARARPARSTVARSRVAGARGLVLQAAHRWLHAGRGSVGDDWSDDPDEAGRDVSQSVARERLRRLDPPVRRGGVRARAGRSVKRRPAVRRRLRALGQQRRMGSGRLLPVPARERELVPPQRKGGAVDQRVLHRQPRRLLCDESRERGLASVLRCPRAPGALRRRDDACARL